MSLPLILADQRLSERRGIKAVIFGKSGIGKTSLLWTLPPDTTLFFDLEAGDLAIEGWTVRPAAIVRMRELADLGLGREDLEDAALELNDKLWRVKASMPKPGPSGEANGELYLFLIEDDA
jgi:ABC-type transport system involved in cytochrome bd biosynthesis fused ATPase/permease subunit